MEPPGFPGGPRRGVPGGVARPVHGCCSSAVDVVTVSLVHCTVGSGELVTVCWPGLTSAHNLNHKDLAYFQI